MNQYLKAAVKRYKKTPVKINPISELDAEIITEIMEIFRKQKNDDVKEILSSYKFIKDEEIRNLLLQYNIDNPDKGENESKDGEEDKPKSKMLQFGDYLVPEKLFFGIKYDESDIDNLRIIINPTNADTVKGNPYINIVIHIEDESEMETFKDSLGDAINQEIIKIY